MDRGCPKIQKVHKLGAIASGKSLDQQLEEKRTFALAVQKETLIQHNLYFFETRLLAKR